MERFEQHERPESLWIIAEDPGRLLTATIAFMTVRVLRGPAGRRTVALDARSGHQHDLLTRQGKYARASTTT